MWNSLSPPFKAATGNVLGGFLLEALEIQTQLRFSAIFLFFLLKKQLLAGCIAML